MKREKSANKPIRQLKFPNGFLWGSATSAYQVEGGITNNDWAVSSRVPKAGVACDHFNRFREDFLLAQKLNHNAHRLSLEWSRIEPEKDQWDEEALHHYFHVLEFLKELGFTTFVTLHHFTNPVWVADAGGWANSKTIDSFLGYVSKVAQSLGQFIDFWVTINEPNIYANLAFFQGLWPPFEKNLIKAYQVYRNMLAAHNQAYEVIHAYYPQAQVGFAQNFSWLKAARENNLFDQLAVKFVNWLVYDFPYQRTQNDFIGVNHYFDTHVKLTFHSKHSFVELKKHPGIKTDRGWPIHPHGLYQVLQKLTSHGKPIYITENGLADAKDQRRAKYIFEYLREIHRAIKRGVPVRGYLHWTLLDSFEWEDGFKWKFGLVEADFETLRRKVRSSARFYAEICKDNSLKL